MTKYLIQVAAIFILLMPQIGAAVEFGARPRFNVGAQYYGYDQDSFSFETPNPDFQDTGSDLEFSDTLPFVNGGLTLFVDRFFVDLSVQYSFDGEDEDDFSINSFIQGDPNAGPNSPIQADTILNFDTQLDAEFDRLEYSVSVGFAVTEEFVVFAGYKRAETEFDIKLQNGQINAFSAANMVPIPFLSGTFTGNQDLEFDYDGPFIGGAYTWAVGTVGALTGNLAVAFMDATVDVKYRDIEVTNQMGVTAPLDLNAVIATGSSGTLDLDGDTIAVSLGITWKGFTPVDGLTYAVGLNGYRYEFDGDNTPDFAETVARLDFGLAYAF